VADRSGRGWLFSLPSLRLGRLFGVPVEVNPSWFLIFVLAGVGLSLGYFPEVFPGRALWLDVASGVVAALLFFGSIVVHEVAHSLVAKRVGLDVERVTLFLFGGVAQLTEEPRTPGAEAVMAVAGPAASVVLALASFGLYAGLVNLGAPDAVWGPLPYLAQVNALVAAFNLLPGFPMDGGRVVRSLLWWATGDKVVATNVASIGGEVVGWGLVAAGLAGALVIGPGLAWLCLLGLFIRSLAARSGRGLARAVRQSVTPVADVMRSPVAREAALAPLSASEAAFGQTTRFARPLVDAADSLDVAARLIAAGAPAVWIVRDGRLVGEVTADDIQGALVRA
jgi:Zn-dependent protease